MFKSDKIDNGKTFFEEWWKVQVKLECARIQVILFNGKNGQKTYIIQGGEITSEKKNKKTKTDVCNDFLQ